MKKIKLAFIAMAAIFCFACESNSDSSSSIVPVKGTNGEYQYIDLSQKGKIVINPQFGQAHTFSDGLALVKVSGGKWGYIDKNGKYIIAPTYDYAQDFSEGVAWVQLEKQTPMLIDKNGKMILQIDSLTWAVPFSNGIATVGYYSEGFTSYKFINKKGEYAVTLTDDDSFYSIINEGIYAFKSKNSKKWGYKNKNGEIVINEQFDDAYPFYDKEMAAVKIDKKCGFINKKGELIINSQYDNCGLYIDDGLFRAKLDDKWGWVNKKGEVVIDFQFGEAESFYGSKLAPVKIGSDKWGYIDIKGKILINPQFKQAFPFNGNYAMIVNDENKIGFINQKGDFIVSPMYAKDTNYTKEYLLTVQQIWSGLPIKYYFSSSKVFEPYERLNEKKKIAKEKAINNAKIDSFSDDRDERVYKTLKFGKQTWMAENLNYNVNGSKCYSNNESNCQKYGRLYNWETAMNACPKGWHLPSNKEWNALAGLAGGGEVAGNILKASSGWANNGNGRDVVGFSALPGGFCTSKNGCVNIGFYGSWWSATEKDASHAYEIYMSHNKTEVYSGEPEKSSFNSVRCVQD